MMKFTSDGEELIAAFVRGIFAGNEEGAHTLDHTMRVYRLTKEIGQAMNADLRILGAAALLHDIGRLRERELGVSHAILSAHMGHEALRRAGYTEEEITRIAEVIRTHRFSEQLTPTSLEGEILSDADKLDAIGAIGIFRAIAQAIVAGKGIEGFLHHVDTKLIRLRDMMYTTAAKKRAEKRHNVLSMFVEQLRQEMDY